jgi:hypothetical protein
MLPKNQRKFHLIGIAFLSTACFLIFGSYRVIATEFHSSYLNTSIPIIVSLKQSNNQLLCSKYKNIGRELEPISNQVLSSSEILFKTKADEKVLSMPAEPLPTIHEAAMKARVPVIMYHDIILKKEVIYDLTPQELNSHLAPGNFNVKTTTTCKGC